MEQKSRNSGVVDKLMYPPPPDLIGRNNELARLHKLWQAAYACQGQTVFVTSEAGMGKSTLVQAFIAQVEAASPGPHKKNDLGSQIARGDCSEQFGREEAFLPFAEALADLLHAAARDQTTARKLLNVIYDCAPAWMGIVPVVGDVLGGLMETAKAAREHFGSSEYTQVRLPDQNRMLQEYTNAILALAQRGPLLLFLDDLHWADAASVALLAHLARRIANRPILIIGAYRPSDLAVQQHPLFQALLELDRYKVCTKIELTTFDLAGLESMVASTLPGHALPAAFLERLYRQTGGVPLYITETLAYLRDVGLVRQEARGWQLAEEVHEIELPTSVEAVIAKRLERLDAEQRRALQYASVEGHQFTSILLARLLEVDELDLEEQLEQVEKIHRLIRFDGEVELGAEWASRYQFSHTLFQKVLYDTLRGKRLRLLHRRVGEALEGIYGDRADKIAHELAVHFEIGQVPRKALEYGLRAARRAMSVYAWDEAALGFERVQRLAQHTEDPDAFAAQVQESLGDIALARARYHDAIASYAAVLEALALAVMEGEEEARARLHRKCARAYEHLGDFPAAFAALDEGLRHAPDDSPEKAALHIMGAGLHHRQGRHREALEWCERVLAMSGLPKVHPIRAHAERLSGVMHTYMGKPDAALESFRLALKIYSRLEDLPGQCDIYSNLGETYTHRGGPGDWAQALENYQRACRLAERMNDSERLARDNANLGWLAYCLGDDQRAIQAYTYSLSIWTQSGASLMCAIVRSNLGAVELARSNYLSALDYLHEAKEALEKIGARGQLAETYRYLALAHLMNGYLAAAHVNAEQSLILARGAEERLGEGGALRVLGQVALAEGELDSAAEALRASHALLEDVGSRYELGQTLVALADLQMRLGDVAHAAVGLAEAVDILTDLGAVRELQQARARQELLSIRGGS
ncbi:MAG: tetratricopeptide repeat protein [Chloroflexi bacterium]|nr:tetratricopeptide repeat protein [Chloroflexota bacterium]